MMDDEQLAAWRAEIPVHCGGCGATFPGDTGLTNGLCRECCRSPIHLIRKVERQAKQIERLRGMVAHAMSALEADQYGEAWAALKASTKENDNA